MDPAVAAGDSSVPVQGNQAPPDWVRLQDTLQSYVLPQLTARGVANLRSTGKTFQAVVDHAPADCILPALRQHLPETDLPAPADSQAAQARLQCHAARIRSMLTGNPSRACSTRVLSLLMHA